MAILGSFATVRSQVPATPGFAAALAYVDALLAPGSAGRARLAALAPGTSARLELGGGVFAMEQAYLSKPRAEGFFESHRRHIDVQVVVEGEEVMEVIDATRIAPAGPFQEDRDFQAYPPATGTLVARFGPGDVAVYFPADVHQPGLRAGEAPVLVRKTVVKVPVA
ncbi:MAG: YhcH/YjgK/YiaL family protein [Verrucomicrobiota bacterium]|nr:DUF386 family protein [Verrucomicrobiota bacterium]